MSATSRIINHENVNGVMLSLKMDMSPGTTSSRLFTISYKNNRNQSYYPKVILITAILFNIIALFYVRISFTAISIIIIVLSFLVFFWITHSVQSETVLVIPTVGIQSSVKYVFGREDNFIPWTNIDDVIINEVIKLNCVLYFLTVLIKTNNSQDEGTKLVPLFKYTKPRLLMLEAIYSELQVLLTEVQRDTSKAAGDTG